MNEQALAQQLNDGNFHSEVQLATELGISSTALKQAIDELKALGLELEYESGSGYRLPSGLRLLDKSRLMASLPRPLWDCFATLDLRLTIDSTSSEAKRYVSAGHQGKALFVAEKQEQGRGRRGKSWSSPMACNLYLSMVWPFVKSQQTLSGLSLVTALSLVKSLQNSKLKGMQELQVKWPNDVWLHDSKLAGILLELHSGGGDSPHLVIIGIGLNVNMPDDVLAAIDQPVTDLRSQGNPGIDRNVILANFLQQFGSDVALFTSHGFAPFRDLWQRFDRFQDQAVELVTESSSISGIVKGVDDSGALLLATAEGIKTIVGGELAPSLKSINR